MPGLFVQDVASTPVRPHHRISITKHPGFAANVPFDEILPGSP